MGRLQAGAGAQEVQDWGAGAGMRGHKSNLGQHGGTRGRGSEGGNRM